MRAGQIFLSYSRKDGEFALKLGEDLRKAGLDIWIDQIDIPPSEPWDEEIEKALQESDCLLVILSQTSVASDNVLNEINYALESKKQVLPVLLENNIKKPFNIGRLQHVDFTGSYEKAFNVLLTSLRASKTPLAKTSASAHKFGRIYVLVAIVVLLSVFCIYNWSKKDVLKSSGTNEQGPASGQQPVSAKLSATIQGDWISEEITNPFYDQDKYQLYFNFEVLGDAVVGSLRKVATAENHRYDIRKAISGGKIKDSILSFSTTEQQILGGETETYKDIYFGSVSNEEIRFTLQSERSTGFPGQKFVARRTAPTKPGP